MSADPDDRDGAGVQRNVHARERLAAVRATGLLDTEAEEAFDRLAGLARTLLAAPFAFVTVVDHQRSFWKAAVGLAEGAPRQNTVEESFCQYVVNSGEPLLLGDVRLDERTRENPSIESMGVVAWAGFPVHAPDGQVLGTICVVDTVPREWTLSQVSALRDLAAIASREVALRAAAETAADAARTAEDAVARAERSGARAELLARIGELLVAGLDLDAVWAAVMKLAVPALGDYAFVHSLPGDGSLTPGVALHRDPACQAELDAVILGADRRVGAAYGPGHVAATGVTEVLADLPALERLSDPERDALRELQAVHSVTVPLRARGQLLAVLSVIRLAGTSPYGPGDVRLVEAIAGRAAMAIDNALAYGQERSLSLHLQRALLPPVLPRPDHLQVSSRYRPAGSAQVVGGDWYDAYQDAREATTLVIGDVAGHDIGAATAMGQLRSMLRMAGHDGGRPPSAVLAAVDAATQGLGISMFATALVARVDRHDDGDPNRPRPTTWSSAGHLPPLLVGADGDARLLASSPQRALGLDLPPGTGLVERTDQATELAPGATLLLYTDGLVERRDEDLDDGLDRLRATAGRLAALPLEEFCDALLDGLSPDGSDDVALVAVRPVARETAAVPATRR